MKKIYAVRDEMIQGVYTEKEFKELKFNKERVSIRVFFENEYNNAKLWSQGKKVKNKKSNPKKDIRYLKTRLFAVKNEEVRGVYTYQEFTEKNIGATKNLSKRTFSKNQLDMAIAWTQGVCVSSYLREKNKDKIELKTSQKNLKGLIELRNLLNEKDIVTGYYEGCIHKEFKSDVNFFPCPWDERVQYGTTSGVDCGCYYHCRKSTKQILDNKDIFLRGIDNLISLLKDNPNWGKDFKTKEGIINKADQAYLDKRNTEEQRKRDIELKKRAELRIKNEVSFKGGCPEGIFSDLRELRKHGAISEDMDLFWEFYDDRFIYTDFYEGLEEKYTHTKENAALIMEFNPNNPEEGLDLMLGNGCMVSVSTIWNDKTKDLIENFYFKWKQYKENNPNKYNTYSNHY